MRILIDTKMYEQTCYLAESFIMNLTLTREGKQFLSFFDFCQRQICSMKLMMKYRLHRSCV